MINFEQELVGIFLLLRHGIQLIALIGLLFIGVIEVQFPFRLESLAFEPKSIAAENVKLVTNLVVKLTKSG